MFPPSSLVPAANGGTLYRYIVRVEMPAATEADYERLHDAMRQIGFLKFIASDDGQVFHLPQAEYSALSILGAEGLRDAVEYTASCVKRGSQVLVTGGGMVAWTLRKAS